MRAFRRSTCSARASRTPPGEPWRRALGPISEWAAAFAAALVVAFAPLILAGVVDDFAQRLRIAHYGASYNRATWASGSSSVLRRSPFCGGSLVSGGFGAG